MMIYSLMPRSTIHLISRLPIFFHPKTINKPMVKPPLQAKLNKRKRLRKQF